MNAGSSEHVASRGFHLDVGAGTERTVAKSLLGSAKEVVQSARPSDRPWRHGKVTVSLLQRTELVVADLPIARVDAACDSKVQ